MIWRMPNPSESLELLSPTNLVTRHARSGLALTGDSRTLIEKVMVGHTEATIRMPSSLLELPDSKSFLVNEITVTVRGTALLLLSAVGENGPISLPAAVESTHSNESPAKQKKQSSVSSPKLQLDVQVLSDVENEVAAMIRRLEPTEQRKRDEKVHWTTHLLNSAKSLTQQVRSSSEALPPPRHTQSVAGGYLKTLARKTFGREPLQKEINTTMPSVVASILVRIMENTNAGGGDMDALRQVIAGHMKTVAGGKLPNSDQKPSRGFQQFAQFILSLKPKDAEGPMGYTERTKSPAQLIAILSGAAKPVNDDGVNTNGAAAQESALRQVSDQCTRLARTRVPEDQQPEHDKLIGELLRTAQASTAFRELSAQAQRGMQSRLSQAAGLLDKRGYVKSGHVMQTKLGQALDGKSVSPGLHQKKK